MSKANDIMFINTYMYGKTANCKGIINRKFEIMVFCWQEEQTGQSDQSFSCVSDILLLNLHGGFLGVHFIPLFNNFHAAYILLYI